MFKQLKVQLNDKRLIEEEIRGLEERIRYKIQKQLGLHATSYSELKIECPIVEDRFAKVFSQIEKLDNQLQELKGELNIIENNLEKIDEILKGLNDKEMMIFRYRYVMGLSIKQVAERTNYSEPQIKRLLSNIAQK